MTTINPFGTNKPSAKALQEASDYIDSKRNTSAEALVERAAMMERMTQSLSEAFGELGVRSLSVGNQTLPLTDPDLRLSAAPQGEAYWTERLNQGNPVAVLNVYCPSSYWKGDLVRMGEQTLATLIDEAQVAALAPSAAVYAPGNHQPWSSVLGAGSFQIWSDQPQEFEALWAALPQWLHTEWHDSVLRREKHFHAAKQVWGIEVAHRMAPDFGWRYAQYVQGERRLEAAHEMGGWDAMAQMELKKMVGSLAAIEGHPMLGEWAAQMLTHMTPALAQSMDGKQRFKQIDRAHRAARDHVFDGVERFRMMLSQWTPTVPQDFFTPAKPASVRRRKPR